MLNAATRAVPGERVATKKIDVPSTKSRMDKLGVQPGTAVFMDGVFDAAFHAELAQRGAQAVTRVQDATLVFVVFDDPEQLLKLGAVRRSMKDDGVVWAVWPKGRQALKEDHIRGAALAEGLVDVKVMRFSESHSGLKLVVRVSERAASSSSRAAPRTKAAPASTPAKSSRRRTPR